MHHFGSSPNSVDVKRRRVWWRTEASVETGDVWLVLFHHTLIAEIFTSVGQEKKWSTSLVTHEDRPWSSTEVLQDEREHLQLMRCWEHWRHVWESIDPVLTLTDPQTKSHQNIEDHRLQYKDTKSCDHERHQVHHRVWGQQHCKDLLSWISAASHLAAELIRTGAQSIVAGAFINAIWNTGRRSERTFHDQGNISPERLRGRSLRIVVQSASWWRCS